MFVSKEKEKLLIEYLLASPEAYSICKPLLQNDYFMKEHTPLVEYVSDYVNKYNAIPSERQVTAETGIDVEYPTDANTKIDWICDQVESFARMQATISAITGATDDLAEENYGNIIEPIKKAVTLSLHRDIGTDYTADPAKRLHSLAENDLQPTGFKDLDDALFGGTMSGGLNFVAANSGGGKSFFLANLAMNWAERKKNVCYITLELKENFLCKRFDQMVSGFTAQDILRKIPEVDAKVRAYGKDTGKIIVKYMPAQTRVHEIESYLKEAELKLGFKFDLVLVDYLDLLMPNDNRVNVNDHFTKDKFSAEELRRLMGDNDYHCWTASQLNRSAVQSLKEQDGEHDHSHISGGISKINTADTVITLAMSTAQKERGILRTQFIKTRTSSGVGKIIPIGFNIDTMRMHDANEEQKEWFSKSSAEKAKETRAAKRTGGGLYSGGLSGSTANDKINRMKQRFSTNG